MIAKLFDILSSPGKGEGLYARSFIPAGTIICLECPRCKTLTDESISALPLDERTFILEHSYRRSTGDLLMPCDETIYLNHSCNSNILEAGPGYDIVVRDMVPGNEATYDYRVFHEKEDFSLDCNCGEPNCAGRISCRHPVPDALRREWDGKLAYALSRIKNVPQPLKKELISVGKCKDLL